MARRLLIGEEDVDRLILVNLDDEQLNTTCLVDNYTLRLCNGPAGVWRHKFAERYLDLGPREDYGYLYRRMRAIETEESLWANKGDRERRMVALALDSRIDKLLLWTIDRYEMGYILTSVIYTLIEQERTKTIEKILDWTEKRNEPTDEEIIDWLGHSVNCDNSEIFYFLLNRYNLKLSADLAGELLTRANRQSLILFKQLWPLATQEARKNAIDAAIAPGKENVIRYGLETVSRPPLLSVVV